MARYGNISTPYKETDIPQPVDPYGVSKLAAENILKILSMTHGVEYNIAVPQYNWAQTKNMMTLIEM